MNFSGAKVGLLSVFLFSAGVSMARLPAGYDSNIPNAEDRSMPGSGYIVYPDFPHLEVVREGTGEPIAAYQEAILNVDVRRMIDVGHFTSLQVRDFAIEKVTMPAGSTTVEVPFAVSVKHNQKRAGAFGAAPLIDQGTIDCTGWLKVVLDQGHVDYIEVMAFHDSYKSSLSFPEIGLRVNTERIGRQLLGANREIDLEFAQIVVKGVLADFFNTDPAHEVHTQTLLRMLQISPTGISAPRVAPN
jgi:hypothetical protein